MREEKKEKKEKKVEKHEVKEVVKETKEVERLAVDASQAKAHTEARTEEHKAKKEAKAEEHKTKKEAHKGRGKDKGPSFVEDSKKPGHPFYQEVLFIDHAAGFEFVCGSTLRPEEKKMFNGKEYPYFSLHTSSASHPFFTGNSKLLDAEGRIEKFNKKYGAKAKKVEAE